MNVANINTFQNARFDIAVAVLALGMAFGVLSRFLG